MQNSIIANFPKRIRQVEKQNLELKKKLSRFAEMDRLSNLF